MLDNLRVGDRYVIDGSLYRVVRNTTDCEVDRKIEFQKVRGKPGRDKLTFYVEGNDYEVFAQARTRIHVRSIYHPERQES